MRRTARTTTNRNQEPQMNEPPQKSKSVETKQPAVPRRSARIAAMNSNTTKNAHANDDALKTTGKVNVKSNPKVKRNNKEKHNDKENSPVQVEVNTEVTTDIIDNQENRLPLESLSLTPGTQKSTKGCLKDLGMPTTPVNIFKTREGIRTPGSRLNNKYNKRNSSSPHPHNFLHKVEDPIVQRIDSPIRPQLSNTEETKSAIYFNQIVEREETKFKLCCDRWNKFFEEGNVPEAVHGQILSAIGQANLFQNKRFKQFKELIELHKDKTAEKPATESDLAGFWEMIFYQVEDVHKRFTELEALKSNNWEEEKAESKGVKKNIQLKVKPKEPLVKKVKKPVVSSKFKMFRQHMMAKKEVEKQSDDIIIL